MALLQAFDPAFSAPMDSNVRQISQPASDNIETELQCAVCYDEIPTDICYFNCKTSENLPKGHTFCNNCVAKIAVLNKPCPLCRADSDETKLNLLLDKNSSFAWTYYLEDLKNTGLDLTKPFNEISISRYTPSQIKRIFEVCLRLLCSGAIIYSLEIHHVVFKAIGLLQSIQTKIMEFPESTQAVKKHIIESKKKLFNEYFKYTHYEIVKEVISKSKKQYDKNYFEILIFSSFKYKNPSLLYDDYMKQITSQQEKESSIAKVIHYATDKCFLEGLIGLIYTIFKNDEDKIMELTIQVIQKSRIKNQETKDEKCLISLTKDYRKYVTKYSPKWVIINNVYYDLEPKST